MNRQAAGKSITVVVPTLNSAATLDYTLMSLIAAKEIRVIVADSFSTDETPEICKRWNVEMVDVPPGNMYRAINAGLRLANTDWLAYVNSDDWVFTGSYRKMIEVAMRSPAAVVYGSTDYVDGSGRFIFSFRAAPGAFAARILRAGSMPFSQPSAIFRASLFKALDGFDERYRSAADYDFFCRAALLDARFQRSGLEPVVAFRVHAGLGAQHPDWNHDEKLLMKGRHRLIPKITDRCVRLLWSISNTRSYFARVLRSYDLFGRVSFQRNSGVPRASSKSAPNE